MKCRGPVVPVCCCAGSGLSARAPTCWGELLQICWLWLPLLATISFTSHPVSDSLKISCAVLKALSIALVSPGLLRETSAAMKVPLSRSNVFCRECQVLTADLPADPSIRIVDAFPFVIAHSANIAVLGEAAELLNDITTLGGLGFVKIRQVLSSPGVVVRSILKPRRGLDNAIPWLAMLFRVNDMSPAFADF